MIAYIRSVGPLPTSRRGERVWIPKIIDEEHVFSATVRVFAERGYAAATTQEIARRAGVSEVTLFRRYGSKLGLIKTALTHCLSNSPFGQVAGGGDVAADLTVIVDAYQRTCRAYGGAVVALLTEMARHPELRDAVSTLLPNLQNAARIIETHQQRGHIAPGEPLEKLTLLIAPVLVAGLWARTGVRVGVFELDTAAVVDAFLNGNRNHPA